VTRLQRASVGRAEGDGWSSRIEVPPPEGIADRDRVAGAGATEIRSGATAQSRDLKTPCFDSTDNAITDLAILQMAANLGPRTVPTGLMGGGGTHTFEGGGGKTCKSGDPAEWLRGMHTRMGLKAEQDQVSSLHNSYRDKHTPFILSTCSAQTLQLPHELGSGNSLPTAVYSPSKRPIAQLSPSAKLVTTEMQRVVEQVRENWLTHTYTRTHTHTHSHTLTHTHTH